MSNTDVFRIVVVLEDGNHQALVFSEPTEGKSYHANQVFSLPGASAVTPNDEGDIPHRELAAGDSHEDADYQDKYGLTWHWQK